MEPRNLKIKNKHKITSTVASTMYSSRIFHPSFCIDEPSTSRNILISDSVLPSTLNHSNQCSCKVKPKIDDNNPDIIVKKNTNNRYIKLSNFDDTYKQSINDRLKDNQKLDKVIN